MKLHDNQIWLQQQHNLGYSIREIAKLAGVSKPVIKSRFIRFNIKSRTISEALKIKPSRHIWTDEDRRQQSSKMKVVQAGRKAELSVSAKKSWEVNREAIIEGIRKVARSPETVRRMDEVRRQNWSNPTYRQKIREMAQLLWQNDEYRELVILMTKKAADSEVIRARLDDPEYRSKYEKELNIDNFLAACYEKHGDRFDYSLAEFGNWNEHITLICNICGYKFERLPHTHMQYGYCQKCGTTKGQREILQFLGDKVEYIINDREAISPLELDIYLPKQKIAIEYHGLYWHSYNQPESSTQKLRHQHKALICRDKNIKLIQLWDFEWSNNNDLVKSIISHALGKSNLFHARDLELESITSQEAKPFFDANHLQGHRHAATILALTNDNQIISAMSLNRYQNGYEIIRMATRIGCSVRGGASRLLANLKLRLNGPIYTFADLRYSTGNVYKQLGFKELKHTKPNYFYYNRDLRLSRQQCQKHKLQALLGDGFNPSKSESANMFINGFRRVWDAGHLKFVL